jgi:regulatory protein
MINSRDYCLKLITIKDRTEKEIRTKLKEKNFDENTIEEEIEFLSNYGYINDNRYAQHFTSDAINIKKWGKSRIRTELLRRGVDRDVVDEVIEEAFSETDDDRLYTEMEKRFKNADFSNMKERTRIFNFYLRRGFSPEEIKGAMNRLSSFRDIED